MCFRSSTYFTNGASFLQIYWRWVCLLSPKIFDLSWLLSLVWRYTTCSYTSNRWFTSNLFNWCYWLNYFLSLLNICHYWRRSDFVSIFWWVYFLLIDLHSWMRWVNLLLDQLHSWICCLYILLIISSLWCSWVNFLLVYLGLRWRWLIVLLWNLFPGISLLF